MGLVAIKCTGEIEGKNNGLRALHFWLNILFIIYCLFIIIYYLFIIYLSLTHILNMSYRNPSMTALKEIVSP